MIAPGQAPNTGSGYRGTRVVKEVSSFSEGGAPGWMLLDAHWALEVSADSALREGGSNGRYKTMVTVRWVFEQTMLKNEDYMGGSRAGSGKYVLEEPAAIMYYAPPSAFDTDFLETGSREWVLKDMDVRNSDDNLRCQTTATAQLRTIYGQITSFEDKADVLPALASIKDIEDV